MLNVRMTKELTRTYNNSYVILQQLRCLQSQNAAAAAVCNKNLSSAKPYESIPTISRLKSLPHFLPGGKYHGKDMINLLLAMHQEYGDIYKWGAGFGQKEMVVTHTPADFEMVLRNEGIWPRRTGMQAIDYHRGVHRADFYQGVEGLTSTQGEQWAKFRSMVNPFLMEPRNVRIYVSKMSDVNKEFIERIKVIRNAKTNEVGENFKDEINRWTLESVAVVALDKHLGLLRHDVIQNEKVKALFKCINEMFETAMIIEMSAAIWKRWQTKKFQRFLQNLDDIQDISMYFIEEAMLRLNEQQAQGITKPSREQSVLEKLLKVDAKVATVMAMDLLAAGVDTTSTAFAGILLCLAKHPEKQQKLRAEVRQLLPQKNSDFSENMLNNVPYLRACIKEALRIYPVTIGNTRELANDTVLSGYRVPKGKNVTMLQLTVNNNDAYYPHASEFMPERWLRSSDKSECPEAALKSGSPFGYLPFGFGPRMCLGKRIVDMELEIGVARLVRNFEIAFNYSTENAFRNVAIMVPNIPLKFKFTDVKN